MAGELLHHLLEHSAGRRPEAEALVQGDTTICYGELERGANRLARLLVARGIAAGDRVALLAHNARFYVEAYYGVLKSGAVVVPLNTAAPPSQLAQLLRHAEARVLLCGTSMLRHVVREPDVLAQLELLVTEGEVRLPALTATLQVASAAQADLDASAPAIVRDAQELAAIVYTSGSTGAPLGACLSHANLVHNARAILDYLPMASSERAFVVLPFYYIYGTSILNSHIAAGAALVLENNFMFPQAALDHLEAEACTSFAGVPSTFAILLHRSNLAQRQLEHLRYVTQAGGAMSPALTRELMAALRGRALYVMYGATEAAGRLTYLPPQELQRELGSIGRPIAGMQVHVLGTNGEELAPGEVGELVASGPSIMQGYWKAADETARVLDAHGLHTGDLGYRSHSGMLYVVGRSKDMIKSGAHRIAAREIEEAILEHEAVHEVAVLGVPDAILGEAIHAYVVPREAGFEVDTLRAFLSTRLASYKIPGTLVCRETLPKNDAGKILKLRLREELGLPTV
ncbi:MAG: class I adenylate-forming enzyme family protein [Pseudomonadota bacterium]